MTRLDKLKEELARDWRNSGCIKGLPVFENARTRWADSDFEAGFDAASAEYQKIIEPLVEALDSVVDWESYCINKSMSAREVLYEACITAKEALENYKKSVE